MVHFPSCSLTLSLFLSLCLSPLPPFLSLSLARSPGPVVERAFKLATMRGFINQRHQALLSASDWKPSFRHRSNTNHRFPGPLLTPLSWKFVGATVSTFCVLARPPSSSSVRLYVRTYVHPFRDSLNHSGFIDGPRGRKARARTGRCPRLLINGPLWTTFSSWFLSVSRVR